jgi:hypothetical protein
VENDLSKWLRIQRLVEQKRCRMDRLASLRVERIVYNRGPRKATVTVHGPMESRKDCLPKNATTRIAPTTSLEKSGSALAKRVEGSTVYVKVYMYI